jgi:hypothetical protein
MIMKKILAIALSLTLVMGMVTGCGSKEAAKTGTAVKTGLAVVTSIGKSASVGEKDGLGQVDSTVVAVLVDAAGKIVDCKIDSAQTKINFNAEGKLTTDLATVQQSKQELGDGYNMKSNSKIGKEWNEQANSLAKYVIGKTVDEVKSIAVNEDTVPTDADLAATVTIKIAGYIQGIEKAVANAKDLGAKEGDKLGLAIDTSIKDSADATAEKEGVAQAYSNYAAVSVDKSGKITSVAIDASQSNVNFSTTGVVTTDLAAELKTKQELGDAYDMKKASSIGKEWYEQADSFAKYVTGKTAAEVTGIKLNDEGKAAETDLSSSVTMHVGPYMSVVAKAANNAK